MIKRCKEPGCENEHSARGWCAYHYRRYKRTQGFEGQPKCNRGCGKPAIIKGLCEKCYNSDRILGLVPGQKLCCFVDLVTGESCKLGVLFKDGYCSKHHQRIKRHGDPSILKKGPNGSGTINSNGYRVFQLGGVKKRKHILEHRRVYAQHLGRELLPEEEVHHKFGGRSDNRFENLELWSTSHPKGQRVEDKIEHAKYILGLYEPEALVLIVPRAKAS
jgi:hypothetical protein